MSMLTNYRYDYEVSTINFLPFVNSSPSDYSTLYTALKHASQIVLNECMKTCIITFDQPLYIKARDIVEAQIFDEIHMVVRFGGFHLLGSYMFCIGQIMAESGIKEIFCIIYAKGSVEKVISGHSYGLWLLMVRAHIILQLALSQLLFAEIKKDNVELQELLENDETMTYIMNMEEIQCNLASQKLNKIFDNKLDEIERRGKTCKLWVKYFKMLKDFRAAERMGNWEIHLNSIDPMILFFHAAGHFNYAKSARLYLQNMTELKETMDPVEY